MSKSLAELIRQLSPTVTPRDIKELPLLTLGSSFQGANNVLIGQKATEAVFLAIAETVEQYITERTEQKLHTLRRATEVPVKSDEEPRKSGPLRS